SRRETLVTSSIQLAAGIVILLGRRGITHGGCLRETTLPHRIRLSRQNDALDGANHCKAGISVTRLGFGDPRSICVKSTVDQVVVGSNPTTHPNPFKGLQLSTKLLSLAKAWSHWRPSRSRESAA